MEPAQAQAQVKVIFEDKSIYDPAKDVRDVVAIRVECNPKQVSPITELLTSVTKHTGVYFVEMSSWELKPQQVIAPKPKPEPAEPLPDEDEEEENVVEKSKPHKKHR